VRLGKRNGGQKKGRSKVSPLHSRASPHPAVARLAAALEERKQLRQQQAATAEILKVIAASPSDVQPVFDAIVRSAVRLCGSLFGFVGRFDGEKLHLAAQHNFPRAALEIAKRTYPAVPDRSRGAGRSIITKSVARIEDIHSDRDYYKAYGKKGGWRRVLAVPMTRGDAVLGTISLAWADPGPITDSQVGLLKTFADQAVIAIENARLFNESKEALERQTATADILQVISSTPTDARPVFKAIVQSALKVFDGMSVHLSLLRDGQLELMAEEGSDSGATARDYPIAVDRASASGTAILERRVVNVADTLSKDAPRLVRTNTGGFRAIACAPLLRQGKGIGVLSVSRRAPGASTAKQLALLQTFADQAVIALENARLFNETKEALEQQTATAEILRVISSTPTDIQPVFDAIAKSAMRIFEGMEVAVALVDGNDFVIRATSVDHARVGVGLRVPLDRNSAGGRSVLDRVVVNIADTESPETPPITRQRARDIGFRAFAAAPMLKEGTAIGHIAVMRRRSIGLSEKQIALLRTFADQAVIAIENTRLFTELQTSNRDLTTALDTQTATSDILRVISRSQTDVQPVFDAIVQSAVRLLRGYSGALSRVSGDEIVLAANTSTDETGDAATKALFPQPLRSEFPHAQAIRAGTPFNVADAQTDGRLLEDARGYAHVRGYRSWIVVPMLRQNEAIGAIGVTRREAGGFTEDEIALLQTFADQAVIAIENVRLFNETKESLERQTATAEILRVISQSQTDTQPVFDAIVRSAVRLCAGGFGSMLRIENDTIRLLAAYNPAPEGSKLIESRFPAPVSEHSLVALAARSGEVVHSPDTAIDPRSSQHAVPRALGVRAQLTVPLLREGKTVALLNVARDTPGPFSDAQIELLKTFADQAVIAIENVRLFNETKEALERQTATAEILRVMSSSPTDVQPVFQAVAERAAELCSAQNASVLIADGDELHTVAAVGAALPFRTLPIRRTLIYGRAFLERRTVHVEDVMPLLDSEYPDARANQAASGFRTLLCVPMTREGSAVGAIGVWRREVKPFTASQIELMETFASQAVIAIENVRLFNETREALERQTATAEILKVIASSPSDVRPVFETICKSAAQLCEAKDAVLWRVDGEMLRVGGHFGDLPVEEVPVAGSAPGRAALDGEVLHVLDLQAETTRFPVGAERARRLGLRTTVSVPLMRKGKAIGVITSRRAEIQPFSDKQIGLLKTFADQAVIAIENVRLFNETKEALEQQTATAEILKVISSSPTATEPVFEAIVQSAARLFDPCRVALVMREGDLLQRKARAGPWDEVDGAALAAIWPLPFDPERSALDHRAPHHRNPGHRSSRLACSRQPACQGGGIPIDYQRPAAAGR
jgi:GAF domain-containing protein